MADLLRPRVEESYETLYPRLNAKNVFRVEFTTSERQEESNPTPADAPRRVLRTRAQEVESPPSKTPEEGTKIVERNLEQIHKDQLVASRGRFSLGPTYARPGLPFSNELANRLSNEPLNLQEDVPQLLKVEYDMDETDAAVMGFVAARFGVQNMTADAFERIMSIIDYSAALISLKTPSKRSATDDGSVDDTQQCAVCLNAESENSNSIVFCDGCDIGVHQDCYGVPFIPEGQWLCRRCQLSRGQNVSCIFCPWKTGAFKQTDTHQWAHVVCGLWIPEAIVPDDAFMEPITGIYNLPRDRWRLKCYICRESVGACIQCSHANCYQAFHPTCAQAAGLYMHVEGGTVGALENPASMRQYCDKHTPPEVKIYTDIAAARKSLEIAEQRGTQSDSLFAVPRYSYWRSPGSGAYAIPRVVVDIVRSESGVEMPEEAIYFLCRYWTIKKDNMGTMFNRAMKHSLDTSQHVSITRREHAHEFSALESMLKKRLALAQKLLKIVAPEPAIQAPVPAPMLNGKTNGKVDQKFTRELDLLPPEPEQRSQRLGPIRSRTKTEPQADPIPNEQTIKAPEVEKRKRGRPRKHFDTPTTRPVSSQSRQDTRRQPQITPPAPTSRTSRESRAQRGTQREAQRRESRRSASDSFPRPRVRTERSRAEYSRQERTEDLNSLHRARTARPSFETPAESASKRDRRDEPLRRLRKR